VELKPIAQREDRNEAVIAPLQLADMLQRRASQLDISLVGQPPKSRRPESRAQARRRAAGTRGGRAATSPRRRKVQRQRSLAR
jgi:hypothetical protein